jgi:hypothetical protein
MVLMIGLKPTITWLLVIAECHVALGRDPCGGTRGGSVRSEQPERGQPSG